MAPGAEVCPVHSVIGLYERTLATISGFIGRGGSKDATVELFCDVQSPTLLLLGRRRWKREGEGNSKEHQSVPFSPNSPEHQGGFMLV